MRGQIDLMKEGDTRLIAEPSIGLRPLQLKP